MEDRRQHGRIESVVAALQAEVTGINRLMVEMDKRYDQQFAAQEKAVGAALAAAEKAVLVAEQNSEKWRSNANEWRGAMDDREEKFVLKEQLNPTMHSMQKEVDELKTFKNLSTGKTIGLDKMWGYLVAAAGSGGVLAFILERMVPK
jgi:hypothetical protein